MSRLTIDEKIDQKKYCGKCKNKKKCLYAACREVDGCHLFERESRLIDANALLRHLSDWWLSEIPGGEVTVINDEVRKTPTNEIIEECIKAVEEQPTAYDITSVVEQLEGHAIEFETFGMCSDYVELTHAIEIVKGSGLNEQTA